MQFQKTNGRDAFALLEDHFHRRFDLIGGRIRLILNLSTTFATLQLELRKALYSISIKDLENIRGVRYD